MNNSGIILTLAYPETIVKLADEWYSPLLRFAGLGKKGYIRAGHAALVLINTKTSQLDYFDFGRYITTVPNGRVRSKETDNELDFPLSADIVNGELKNLEEILHFLATNPKLTHGEGRLIASVCDEVDYDNALEYISEIKNQYFVRYGAFMKNASNCARFVTDTLIASTTNQEVKKKLIKSNKFTPSTIGNTILADTKNKVYDISPEGVISEFKVPAKWSNIRFNAQFFIDPLNEHIQTFEGTIEPKMFDNISDHAQWLGGIGSGAWFELHKTEVDYEFRFRRISLNGVDIDAIFVLEDLTFNYDDDYKFDHYSNCNFCHVKQNGKMYKFSYVRLFNSTPLAQIV